MSRALIYLMSCLVVTGAMANALEKKLGPKGCWQRIYEASHLAKHLKQQVTEIRLSTEVQEDGTFIANLGVNLRKRIETGTFDYALFGICKAKGPDILCETEWDAGTFTLQAAPEANLRVRNGKLIFNPANYAAEEVAPNAVDLSKSDDAVWLLSLLKDGKCEVY